MLRRDQDGGNLYAYLSKFSGPKHPYFRGRATFDFSCNATFDKAGQSLAVVGVHSYEVNTFSSCKIGDAFRHRF